MRKAFKARMKARRERKYETAGRVRAVPPRCGGACGREVVAPAAGPAAGSRLAAAPPPRRRAAFAPRSAHRTPANRVPYDRSSQAEPFHRFRFDRCRFGPFRARDRPAGGGARTNARTKRK